MSDDGSEPLLLQLTAWLLQQDLHQDAGEGLTIEVKAQLEGRGSHSTCSLIVIMHRRWTCWSCVARQSVTTISYLSC